MSRRLRPLADREAILALGLAGAGFLSLEATLPAAGALAVRSFRTQQVVRRYRARPSGCWCSEPRGSASCSATRRCERCGSRRPSTTTPRGRGLRRRWLALAASAAAARELPAADATPNASSLRAVARAGIVTVIAAGLLQFIGDHERDAAGGVEGLRRLDGRLRRLPPWASLVPALAVGAAWLVLSLAISGVAGPDDDDRSGPTDERSVARRLPLGRRQQDQGHRGRHAPPIIAGATWPFTPRRDAAAALPGPTHDGGPRPATAA